MWHMPICLIDLFPPRDELKRDPTNVELFDIAQSNSEHSRHWFFKADLIIDGEKVRFTCNECFCEQLH